MAYSGSEGKMTKNELVAGLNAAPSEERLSAARGLAALQSAGKIPAPETSGYVNNHIHTIYSFSPYSPTKAVWASREAGLAVSGIVDHDSVAGVREFREAGRVFGFPTTAGFELRSDHTATALGPRRTNNPDQAGVSYMTFHGLRDSEIDAVAEFLKPVAKARGERNRAMCERLADLSGLSLHYDADVVPLSRGAEGGSVTERHLLCALSLAAIREYGGSGSGSSASSPSGSSSPAPSPTDPTSQPGDALFYFFKNKLSFTDGDIDKLKTSWKTSIYNSAKYNSANGDHRNGYDGSGTPPPSAGHTIAPASAGTSSTFAKPATSCPYGNDFFLYDLIGILKASLVESFYIPAGPVECPPLAGLVEFARAHDIIITYPYLGDVTSSVTGDKKAQKFEDDYLDELFGILKAEGVGAISYMPARNTREQAERVRELAERYGMLQISGEDINSPRQPFISEASKDPYFANLRETTWRLVEHEKGAIDLVRP
ncbi:MAG: hypothetical protein LBL54_04300 [Clostridiales Family XIII bacterium]|jgi:hypothetical protein|nr:hypothetical protein [Clostridiales Family XIII bacterium]